MASRQLVNLFTVALGAALWLAAPTAPLAQQRPAGDPTVRLEQQQAQTRNEVNALQAEVAALRERLDALAGPVPGERTVKLTQGNSPVRGNPDAPITITLFGDYQSDYATRAHYTVKRLLEDYAGQVKVVFKHYPLTTMHPQANEAALAAIAAEKQGKFWEMNDLLFQNSRRLEPSVYIVLAEQAGLNVSQFERDRRSVGALERLSEDEKAATEASVAGVPAVFLNGRPMQTWRYDYLRGQIDLLRKK
ncbi:MAG TPA: thioredoxin domain-containing protein [bacterium]